MGGEKKIFDIDILGEAAEKSIPPSILHSLAEDAPKGNSALYLVGSAARNELDEYSDIDLTGVCHDAACERWSKSLALETGPQGFWTKTWIASDGVPETTLKLFSLSAFDDLFAKDAIVMGYIYFDAVELVPWAHSEAIIQFHRDSFNRNSLGWAQLEIARARNALYSLELAALRDHHRQTHDLLSMDFWERLAKAAFLLLGRPYPYKKWIFEKARDLPHFGDVFLDYDDVVSKHEIPALRSGYTVFLEVARSCSSSCFDTSEFAYEAESYYRLLNW